MGAFERDLSSLAWGPHSTSKFRIRIFEFILVSLTHSGGRREAFSLKAERGIFRKDQINTCMNSRFHGILDVITYYAIKIAYRMLCIINVQFKYKMVSR